MKKCNCFSLQNKYFSCLIRQIKTFLQNAQFTMDINCKETTQENTMFYSIALFLFSGFDLYIKSKMHNITILHLIFFPFNRHLARFTACRL